MSDRFAQELARTDTNFTPITLYFHPIRFLKKGIRVIFRTFHVVIFDIPMLSCFKPPLIHIYTAKLQCSPCRIYLKYQSRQLNSISLPNSIHSYSRFLSMRLFRVSRSTRLAPLIYSLVPNEFSLCTTWCYFVIC